MLNKRSTRLNRLRHVYQLLHQVQVNGFDESLWRRILLQGIERCFSVEHVWSGMICDKQVGCEQLSFDELATSSSSHVLVQMCDQFKQRWSRALGHPDFDVTEVIQWVSQTVGGENEVWYQSDYLRLEKLNLGGREVLLLIYRLNAKHLRCFLFESLQAIEDKQATENQRFNKQRLSRVLILEIIKMIRHSRLSTDCYLSHPLSPREAQTGRYLLQGYTEKEIANQMYLSPHTIHTYIKSIYRQFNVTSRAEFTSLFVSHVPVGQYFQLGSIEKRFDDSDALSHDSNFDSMLV